ncbi:NUDIX domain-containing protein [Streptomyces sp. KHY 26]|uniref:NUDIX domain-containing protein n=1 Tax=Streptomyces sp. KHY 26 TaxID=3097359 RepID=UPI00376F40A8
MSGQPAQPTIDTHVLLRDGDKILLSQRGGPYGHGRWHLPSGKLDQGEPLTAGAARELNGSPTMTSPRTSSSTPPPACTAASTSPVA